MGSAGSHEQRSRESEDELIRLSRAAVARDLVEASVAAEAELRRALRSIVLVREFAAQQLDG
jgi:hypothetical protein